MRLTYVLFAALFIAFSMRTVLAEDFDYQLQPIEIAKNTYLLEGKLEDFSVENGGFIVNTAFIITDDGVIVIDSGPSYLFAKQQRAAIAKITDKEILRVYITHHHPDHFLGNQAYKDVPVYALPSSIQGMQSEGEAFLSNMYRLVGGGMSETVLTVPTENVKEGIEKIGDHNLQMIPMQGHTAGDLVIFDHTTGVLFAGDLVFNQRAATTPHALMKTWLRSLRKLARLPFKIIVPGHGSVGGDIKPINQTSDYLEWLLETLQIGAQSGMDMLEIMQSPIPKRFKHIRLLQEELSRSVTHLFPKIEDSVLRPINTNN